MDFLRFYEFFVLQSCFFINILSANGPHLQVNVYCKNVKEKWQHSEDTSSHLKGTAECLDFFNFSQHPLRSVHFCVRLCVNIFATCLRASYVCTVVSACVQVYVYNIYVRV